ncbi:MAG TPA: hypothetical protein VJ302_36380, partial [Blastocatellia bacterium]|nr:hypothetical protein [Blastocatellia bacterium]
MKPSGLGAQVVATLYALALFGATCCLDRTTASAQEILRPARRKPARIQKRAERREANKLAPGTDTTTRGEIEMTTFKENVRPEKHSLDGISKIGMVDFFSREERQLVIPGFGRPGAYLIILRQLDLTDPQKQGLRLIRRRIGDQLVRNRQQQNQLESQLEEAIYGENFDPKRVEEITSQLGETQAQTLKIQAGIEMDLRQIFTS